MSLPLVLVDADLLLYRSASAAEFELWWGDDICYLHTNMVAAKEDLARLLTEIEQRFQPCEMVLCVSDAHTFRKDVLATYKANRKKVRKPLGYVALREWMAEQHKTISKPNLEADDVLGILATKPGVQRERIVVSEDKDLKTIPGQLWRQDRLTTITEEEADRFWLYQTLTGDVTDGYSGLPGTGPKKAEAILDKACTWAAVEAAYVKAGLTPDDALTQARMARILRWSDWDHENQKVKLWTPSA